MTKNFRATAAKSLQVGFLEFGFCHSFVIRHLDFGIHLEFMRVGPARRVRYVCRSNVTDVFSGRRGVSTGLLTRRANLAVARRSCRAAGICAYLGPPSSMAD